jgi:hypothetical protein
VSTRGLAGSPVVRRGAGVLVAVLSMSGLAACAEERKDDVTPQATASGTPSATADAVSAPTGTATAAPVAEVVPGTTHNVATDWATIVTPAVHNPAEPRPPVSAAVTHTVAYLAVYDAVVAIEGGYAPFGPALTVPKDTLEAADLDAAVATAAYKAARGRVNPSQHAYLDRAYEKYMAALPEGPGRTAGVAVGEAAAAGILALRAGDGYATARSYACSAVPPPIGEFEPNGGCSTQPVDVRVAGVRPYTFADPARFRPAAKPDLTSEAYAKDFDEVKTYGRSDSTARTAEQTDVVHFWAEHTYVHWNRNLADLAKARDLSVADTARLFAMAFTAASDAGIAGFEAKYHYKFWRPRVAIPKAADDGNDRTEPDPKWTPLLTVDHPEFPSGHGFVSSAFLDAVAAFFGTRQVAWTLTTNKTAVPKVVKGERSYPNLDAILDEISNARVHGGLHFRGSMDAGEELGEKVAAHVLAEKFKKTG